MNAASGAGQASVLTVTHDRPSAVRALLASIGEDEEIRWERIVLVDDSVDPPAYAEEFPRLPIDHLQLPHRVFISRAKNLGLARIGTEFVFCVDDDNRVPVGTPSALLRRFAEDPRLAAVMPSVLYAGEPELVWVYATPFADGRWSFQLLGRNRPRDPTLERTLLPTDALPNASMIRTSAARSIGGFDEALPINSSADFCQRLKAAGGHVLADPGAFVVHDVERPGARAFWAAHSVDRSRLYFEVRDWFVFHRRLRTGERMVRGRALWHAAPFLGAQAIGLLLRRDGRAVPSLATLGRGVVDGLSAPVLRAR